MAVQSANVEIRRKKSVFFSHVVSFLMTAGIIVGTTLLMGILFLQSSALILVAAAVLIAALALIYEGLMRFSRYLVLLFTGSKLRASRKLANTMSETIARELDIECVIAAMENTGAVIRVVLELAKPRMSPVKEVVVIPHDYLFDTNYWKQMTQGIINMYRGRF